MWSTVLVLSLLAGLDPIRLGWTLLVLSRPRPMQNLLAYWAGTMVVSVPYMFGPLLLLHVTPMSRSFSDGLAASPTVRHIQIGLGLLALSIAALVTVRSRMRQRQRAQVLTPSTTSTAAPDSNTASAMSSLREAQDAATEDRSAIRRLVDRAKNAWEDGSLWVAFVIGVGAVPPIDGVFFLLAVAVTSGAPIGTQVLAATVFVLGTLSVVEILLASYLAMPAKAEALLRMLHKWALAHRRHVLVAMIAVGGVSMVAHGVGSI